jgi:hypothetical protein
MVAIINALVVIDEKKFFSFQILLGFVVLLEEKNIIICFVEVE